MNILICDDEKEIVDALALYLKNENYTIFKAYTGKEALAIAAQEMIHLALLDIMMPEMDGLKAAVKLRETERFPIIFISAKSEDNDKITGLTMGGDDYITKPFNPLEVVARVKSQLRRYTALGAYVEKTGIYCTGGLELNDDYKSVTVDGDGVKLTPVEFKILRLLMSEMGKVFSIEHIYESVWEEPAYRADNTVAVHIRRIREKIEINPKEPKYLKVVWGIGYKIEKYPV